MRAQVFTGVSLLGLLLLAVGCGSTSDDADDAVDGGDGDEGMTVEEDVIPGTVDPGTGEWEPVPRDELMEVCELDAELLDAADEKMTTPYAIVRHGRLCHEYYPEGRDKDTVIGVASATKTLGAAMVGAVIYQTRELAVDGDKTGPLSEFDRVDAWLDSFSFNQDAQIAHVMAMVGHNADLSWGEKVRNYDTTGSVQINRLSDILNAAIAQDTERLGADLHEFSQRHFFDKIGATSSSWSGTGANKIFGFSWNANVRDMARVGLLLLNDGVWSGERLIGPDYVYRMSRPTFEDADTGYGYLSWLAARANWSFAGIVPGLSDKFETPSMDCMPSAIWESYPHELSEAQDCMYAPHARCGNEYDVGTWSAQGAGGQYILMIDALDMVLVLQDVGENQNNLAWLRIRPAVIAGDPVFADDPSGFCDAFAGNRHAPHLME